MRIALYEFTCPICGRGRVRGLFKPHLLPTVPPSRPRDGGQFGVHGDYLSCRCSAAQVGAWVDEHGLPEEAIDVSSQALNPWTPAFHPVYPVGTWGLPPGWEAVVEPAAEWIPNAMDTWFWRPRGADLLSLPTPPHVAIQIAPHPRRRPGHSAFFPGLRDDDGRELVISIGDDQKIPALLERGDTCLLSDFELGELALSLKAHLPRDSREEVLRAIAGLWYHPFYWREDSFCVRQKRQNQSPPGASQLSLDDAPASASDPNLDDAPTGEYLVTPVHRPPRLVLYLEGREYPVTELPFIIGRVDKYCSLAIRSGDISQRHCAISLEDGRYILEDLRSTNGIAKRVGDQVQPVVRAVIADGDCFVLPGDKELRCELRPDEDDCSTGYLPSVQLAGQLAS